MLESDRPQEVETSADGSTVSVIHAAQISGNWAMKSGPLWPFPAVYAVLRQVDMWSQVRSAMRRAHLAASSSSGWLAPPRPR